MIYFLCLSIMCFSAFIGNKLSQILVKRECFYKKLYDFCEFSKMNISFLNKKTSDIFDQFKESQSSRFDCYFDEFKECQNHNCYADVLKTCMFIKKDEKETIANFFKIFGQSDSENQLALIENFEKYVSDILTLASQKRKNEQGLIYKISLAIGVVICILII